MAAQSEFFQFHIDPWLMWAGVNPHPPWPWSLCSHHTIYNLTVGSIFIKVSLIITFFVFVIPVSLPVLGNDSAEWERAALPGHGWQTWGEASWPFLNPDSKLARSGQLFSCSWCVLHPARLSLAACLTHYSERRGAHTHTHTLSLLWFLPN